MNPLTLFLGNGFPKNDTIYGRFLDDLADYWGFFPEDVGFIGYMYFYGLLYVIAYFRLVYKVLLVYREYVPTDYVFITIEQPKLIRNIRV